MRIGLLGGSFDPVHLAHLTLANTALESLALDQVQLIPAGQPWQRPPLGATPSQRLKMLELATEGLGNITVNPIEIHRSGPTYTIETIEALEPGHDYFWILGADQLENFCTWRRWQEIVNRVQLAVAQRPGSAPLPPKELATWLGTHHRNIVLLPFEPLDISASAVRQRLSQHESTRDLLPEVVEQYIYEHGLYRPLTA
jgi:nicotinate-nucleotide adenylyltransferase